MPPLSSIRVPYTFHPVWTQHSWCDHDTAWSGFASRWSTTQVFWIRFLTAKCQTVFLKYWQQLEGNHFQQPTWPRKWFDIRKRWTFYWEGKNSTAALRPAAVVPAPPWWICTSIQIPLSLCYNQSCWKKVATSCSTNRSDEKILSSPSQHVSTSPLMEQL